MLAHEVNNSTAGITAILDMVSSELQEAGADELVDALERVWINGFSRSGFVSFAEVVEGA